MITINGSQGEGGGQIVRTSVALSAVTAIPLKIENIRSGREIPGLKAQHISGIVAVAELCDADVKGAVIGSTELEFIPGSIVSQDIRIDIPTAGSIGLVLQALMIPLIKLQRRIDITINGGGTYGKWSPPLVYIKNILCPLLSEMGYEISVRIERDGYYPRGGARVYVSVNTLKDGKLKAIDLSERGKLLKIDGIAHSSSNLEKAEVSSREAESVQEYLSSRYDIPIDIEAAYSECYSTGSGVTLRAIFGNSIMGADTLGERGVPAEVVGRNAAKELASFIDSGASVDEFLSDQLLPYMALAEGTSRFTTKSLSSHARTNMDIISKFIEVDYSIETKNNLTMVSVRPMKQNRVL